VSCDGRNPTVPRRGCRATVGLACDGTQQRGYTSVGASGRVESDGGMDLIEGGVGDGGGWSMQPWAGKGGRCAVGQQLGEEPEMGNVR